MPPLLDTPTLQSHLKFCPKQEKSSYFDQYARPIPKHNLLKQSCTSTVTGHQESVHGCFPLLESNLDL